MIWKLVATLAIAVPLGGQSFFPPGANLQLWRTARNRLTDEVTGKHSR